MARQWTVAISMLLIGIHAFMDSSKQSSGIRSSGVIFVFVSRVTHIDGRVCRIGNMLMEAGDVVVLINLSFKDLSAAP